MNITTSHLRAFVSCCFAVVISGCGGGGAVSSALPTAAQSLNTGSTRQAKSLQTAGGNVGFSISITPPKPSAGSVAPKYISPSTASLTILVDGANPVSVDISPSSPNCSANANASGSYICTLSLTVPAGNHVFTVTAYGAEVCQFSGCTPGPVLSTNSTGTVYVKSIGETKISLVLEGVVAYVALSLGAPNPPVGKPAKIGLTVTLQDAAGEYIVGPAAYEFPITLTTTDPMDAALSKTTLHSPADASGITVSYTGANVTQVTLSAMATALPPTHVTNAVLTPGAGALTFTEYPIPIANAAPGAITSGPDGALWFGETGQIGRVTTGGSFTEYAPPQLSLSVFGGIAAGPDGALWFSAVSDDPDYIGRISTSGSTTLYLLKASGLQAMGVAFGPDRALWFTEGGLFIGSRIGRLSTSGSYSDFAIPSGGAGTSICLGPDGALWFTTQFGSRGNPIGRITTSGSITEFPVPASLGGSLTGITLGSDHALWFIGSANVIGRITTAGSVSEYPLPVAGSAPTSLAAGPDGALWFTQTGYGQPQPIGMIGRITTDGDITEHPIPTPNGGPNGITAGPDGAMWFTEGAADKIGKLSLP